jgi:DNA polymerase III delta subunit
MAARAQVPPPPVQLSGLASSLEKEGLARGYVLRGEESYFRERAIELLKARADEAGWEVRLQDADRSNHDFKIAEAIGDLTGGGLFASQRLVVIRNAERYLRKAEGKKSALTGAIERFVTAGENPGCVVLSAISLRADLVAVKVIEKAGGRRLDLRKLWDDPPPWKPDPRQTELVQWLVQRARERGVRLDASGAVYVCAATGNDLSALEDQLDRLKGASGQELRRVIGWNPDAAPWTVADRFLDGELPRALAGVETLFTGGFHEKGGRRLVDTTALSTMLVGALVRGVRAAHGLAREFAQGSDEATALRSTGVKGAPRTLKTIVARARSRPAEAWRMMLEDLAELDRRSKSGTSLDAAEFVTLALRWNRAHPPRETRG